MIVSMVNVNSKRKKAYQNVIDRDNGMCQVCGNKADDVHHIIGRRNGSDSPMNLICLCRYCHNVVHRNTKKWTPILIELNERHYGKITIKDLKKKGKYDGFKY